MIWNPKAPVHASIAQSSHDQRVREGIHMKFERAVVIGAGAMGSGIAQVLSQAGIEVVLKDVKEEFVERGLKNIKRMYDSRVKKEVLTQAEADYLFGQIRGTTSYDEIGQPDIVIEAALETIDVKLEIFKTLDKICPPGTILATNTSALSISEIASITKRPDKVVGMHFFNPAQTMKLVEVIPGVKTSDDTVKHAMNLCNDVIKKIPVRVKECPGFLVNRLLFPYMNEALYVLQEGASPNEVDEMVVKFGMPMGPFTLFDMTGIDICAHVNSFLYKEYGPRFEPSPLLDKLVSHGCLGQKTGSGFYLHEEGQIPQKGEAKKVNPKLEQIIKEANSAKSFQRSTKKLDAHRIMLPMFNEALYALQEEVVSASDIDVGMQWGCGMKNGILSLAEEKGLEWCLSEMEAHHKELGERFRPSWYLKKLQRAGLRDFSQLSPEPLAVR